MSIAIFFAFLIAPALALPNLQDKKILTCDNSFCLLANKRKQDFFVSNPSMNKYNKHYAENTNNKSKDEAKNNIIIKNAFVRASIGKSKNTAGYMTIYSRIPDKLVTVETPFANTIELHTVIINEEGIMRMRPIKEINITPNSPIKMEPGGMHLMIMGLASPLKDGDTVPLTLTFQKFGKLKYVFSVRKNIDDNH